MANQFWLIWSAVSVVIRLVGCHSKHQQKLNVAYLALNAINHNNMSIFLDPSDVAMLTGKKLKSQQVAVLRKMGIVCFVNASGHPAVPKSAVEGKINTSAQQEKPWVPALARNHG